MRALSPACPYTSITLYVDQAYLGYTVSPSLGHPSIDWTNSSVDLIISFPVQLVTQVDIQDHWLFKSSSLSYPKEKKSSVTGGTVPHTWCIAQAGGLDHALNGIDGSPDLVWQISGSSMRTLNGSLILENHQSIPKRAFHWRNREIVKPVDCRHGHRNPSWRGRLILVPWKWGWRGVVDGGSIVNGIQIQIYKNFIPILFHWT